MEAARIAKVPRSTVGYWSRTNLVAPSYRTGRVHLYTFEDLRDLVVAGNLREQGAKVRDLRAALTYVRSVDSIERLAQANFAVADGIIVYTNEGRGVSTDQPIAPAKQGLRVFRLSMADVFEELGAAPGSVTHLRPARRVVVDPSIRGGTPVIEGTRIPVQLIADLLVEGLSIADVMEHYPSLKPDDVRAAAEWEDVALKEVAGR